MQKKGEESCQRKCKTVFGKLQEQRTSHEASVGKADAGFPGRGHPLFAEIAVELGFQTTPEEMAAALTELEEARKTQTNATVDKMEKMEDDDLEDVAGGVYYYKYVNSNEECRSGQNYVKVDGCEYDFRDSSCSIQDACDYFSVTYFDCYVSFYAPGTENYCSVNHFKGLRNKSYPK